MMPGEAAIGVSVAEGMAELWTAGRFEGCDKTGAPRTRAYSTTTCGVCGRRGALRSRMTNAGGSLSVPGRDAGGRGGLRGRCVETCQPET